MSYLLWKRNIKHLFIPKRVVWQEKSPDHATTELAKKATELHQVIAQAESANEKEKQQLLKIKRRLIIEIGKELEKNGRNIKPALLLNLTDNSLDEYIRKGVAVSFDTNKDNGKKILSILLKDSAFVWLGLADNDTMDGKTLRKMAFDPDKGGVSLKQRVLRNPNCPAKLKEEILKEFDQRRKSGSRG